MFSNRKKITIHSNDLYIYSTDYMGKYLKYLIFIALFFFVLFFAFIYTYLYVPKKSIANGDNPISITSNSKNVIADDNGIYYTGSFTDPPISIPVNINSQLNEALEILYLYVFHDNQAVLFRLYKKKQEKIFSYTSFNLIDKDIEEMEIVEKKATHLNFYDNFTKSQFSKKEGNFYLEIPSFDITSSKLTANIGNILNSSFKFSFPRFDASMVNWDKNKALYVAMAFGKPDGHLIVPGNNIVLDKNSSVLAIHLVGETPYRYKHNIISGVVYTSYEFTPIPFFIYDSKPESDNSRILKFYYKNKWHISTNFNTHTYKNSTDYYSREEGLSFLFTKDSKYIKNKNGLFSYRNSKVDEGRITGYIKTGKTNIQISGTAIREKLHLINLY